MIFETFYFFIILKIAPVNFSRSSIFLSWLQVYTIMVSRKLLVILLPMSQNTCVLQIYYRLCRKLALINASPPVSLAFGVLNICIWPEKSKYFETPSQNFPLITSFKTSLIMLVTEVRMERMFLITSMHPLNTNKVAENLRCIDIFPITISFTFKFEFNLLYCLIMYFYQSLP